MARSRRAPAATPAPRLAARLEREPLPPVVVLAGAERWFHGEGVAAILGKALPAGDPGGALVRVNARVPEERERVAGALEELRTPSLFGAGKVVVLENAEAAAGSKDRSGAAALTRLATDAARSAPSGAHLVLSTALPVKGRGAVATKALLEAGAWVVDCRALYDAPAPWERGASPHDHELSRFLVTRMHRAHGKRLGLDDAHALSRLAGSELGALDDALRSLALYAGTREAVTGDDLARIVGRTREDPVWKLVDAALDGDAPTAMDLVEQAFDRGLSDARGAVTVRPEALCAMIVAALHGSFRRILGGSEALARGEEPGGIARAQGVPPFLADRFLERCRRDPGRLLDLHGAFFEAEAGVKGGGVPPRLATERLVARLARGMAAARAAGVAPRP
jgi:DNA polymerase III delta subunit